jgi:lipopolysaccharide/colanic/teichoic acid biosynthesis glycosyltransferase
MWTLGEGGAAAIMRAESTGITIAPDSEAELAQGAVEVLDASRKGHGAAEELETTVSFGLLPRAAKRTIDLVGALLLLIMLLPLWIAIALLIKADSPGPILFRQRRVGRGGRSFGMIKFRTMVEGADARKPALLHLNDAAEGLFKISDDPRVTKVGRWLRATCLDEMPQLLHVITGQMSLVGPRPLVPDEDAQIRGVYRERLAMRPGMTGPWQVEGASAIPIHGMVLLDRYYVEEWSPWLDLKLLTRTAALVIARRGL